MDGGTADLGTFNALGHTFRVTVEGRAPVDVGAVLGDLAAADVDPAVTYSFRYGTGDDAVLLEDGVETSSGTTRTLLQMLISRLGLAVSQKTRSLSIHANTVRVGDGTVLLAGRSGQGKSTLTARLLLDRAALVAEDISVPDPETLAVAEYHRPLGLSEASFDVLGIPIPPEAGEPCGCGGKVLVTAEMLGSSLAGSARPTVVALVDQTSDTLTRLSPATAFTRILELGIAPTPERERDLDALIRLLAECECFAVGSADLSLAADWVRQIAAARPPTLVPTLVERHGDRIDVYAGTEAVLVTADQARLLNQSAAAIWFLWTDGASSSEIASVLGVNRAAVDSVVDGLPPR